jgi:hypothetical protein
MAGGRQVRPLAEPGVDMIDDKVRARLAEIRASAGVPHAQITLEVLYFLPKAFLQQYADMFTRAVKADGGEDARNRSQHEAGEVGKATGGSSGGAGKRYKKTFVVLDEHALELKTGIDKRLRMIARDIEGGLSGQVAEKRTSQCSSCGMFLQLGWKFCPKDGSSQINE